MKPKTCLFLPVISVLLLSCNTPRYMYAPSASNVPVLVKQGDSKLAAYYSTDLSGTSLSTNTSGKNKSNGLDVQGAVAITDNFAIQGSYMSRSERNASDENNVDNTVITYKRNLAEFGIGYFNSMHSQDKVLFQFFGGVGKGRFSFVDDGIDDNGVYGLRHHEADVFKVYFQPAFLFRPKENFVLSISSRFSIISFSDIKTDYSDLELQSYLLHDLPHGSRTFWEPAFTNTIGFKNLPGLKLEYQVAFALQVDQRYIDYRNFNLALGIAFDIPKLFKPAPAVNKN